MKHLEAEEEVLEKLGSNRGPLAEAQDILDEASRSLEKTFRGNIPLASDEVRKLDREIDDAAEATGSAKYHAKKLSEGRVS